MVCARVPMPEPFQSTLPVGEATGPIRRGRALSAFQSTLPVGEATPEIPDVVALEKISIHASRGGSDALGYPAESAHHHFNPRFPWGKRPLRVTSNGSMISFQSTLPVGEATPLPPRRYPGPRISIHASRGGSDQHRANRNGSSFQFQSTLPVGEAT